jgi:HAMP domain-containing protein
MLVFALVLLWLAACLGVISVWVLRRVSPDSPESDASDRREPTTR